MSDSITIRNVGAVAELNIPLEPGVVCLAGHNGSGKSTALRAVEALTTGDAPDLEVRDGTDEDERGVVEGLGARLTVGRRRSSATDKPEGRNRTTGELEVQSLRGLNPLDLVNPGTENPVLRDERRIRLLCDLARVKGGIELFTASLGKGVKALASRKTLDATSVPEMAASLKRDIQAEARASEEVVTRLDGEIEANLKASDCVSAEVTGEQPDLEGALHGAIRRRDELAGRAAQAKRSEEAAAKARAQLEQSRARYDGPTSEQAAAALTEVECRMAEKHQAMLTLQAELSDLRVQQSALKAEQSRALDHERNIETWQASIEQAAAAVAVDPADLERADAAIKLAQRAKDDAAVVAEKRKRRRDAEEAITKRDAQRKKAAELRELADRCDAVVSDVINRAAPSGLRVKEGRLVLNTARGETLVDDLSFGEGVRLAVGIAAQSFGAERALLVVPQEAFEGLDPKNQAELDAIAREAGVVIVTARATEGELRVSSPVAEPAVPAVA